MSPSWLQHKMLSHPMIPYHCSLRISTQETKPLLFHNNWVFFYFQQNPVISKYRPRGTNTARVKSNIGVLWYGDQFFCWVKRFININHGTFAYVTHGTTFPEKTGNRTCAIPPCVAFWSPDLKWPWQLLEQGQYTWQGARLPKHTVNYGAPVWFGEMPKMLELTFQKPERLGSHSEVFKWVNFSRKLRTIHCYYRFYGSDVKIN